MKKKVRINLILNHPPLTGKSRPDDEEMESAPIESDTPTAALETKSTGAVIPSKSEAMSFLGLKLSKMSEGATSNNWNMASTNGGKRNGSGGDLEEDEEDFGLRDVEPSGQNVAALLNRSKDIPIFFS